MLQRLAMILLVPGGVLAAGTAVAAETAPVTAESPALLMQQAAQRAVSKLAGQLAVVESAITVTGNEPQTWPDSSMGCGRPGTAALTVVTEGYAVTLTAGGKQYRVHVSQSNATICDRPPLARKELRRPANARGLEAVIDLARADLAKRLGVDLTAVRLSRSQPQEFADSGLGCPRSDEQVLAGPVPGYKLYLRHAARMYTYHTDLKDVRPCPAIENN